MTATQSAQTKAPSLHSWVVVDTTDPMFEWTLRVRPDQQDAVAKRLVEVISASDALSVVATDGEPTVLDAIAHQGVSAVPTFDAVEEGLVRYASKFASRSPQLTVVDKWTEDLGAILRASEPVDATFQRRFCAPRPPLVFFADIEDSTFSLGTWTDAYTQRADALAGEGAPDAVNQARLNELLHAFARVAQEYGGTFGPERAQ